MRTGDMSARVVKTTVSYLLRRMFFFVSLGNLLRCLNLLGGQHLLSPVSPRQLALLGELADTKLTQVRSESHNSALSRLIVLFPVKSAAAYAEAMDFLSRLLLRSLLLAADTSQVSHCPAMASCCSCGSFSPVFRLPFNRGSFRIKSNPMETDYVVGQLVCIL